MKKKKLGLNELKVKSFITTFDGISDQTLDIQGGASGQTCHCTWVKLGCTTESVDLPCDM